LCAMFVASRSLGSQHADLARLQDHAIEKRPIDLAVVTRDVLRISAPRRWTPESKLCWNRSRKAPLVVQRRRSCGSERPGDLVGNALVHAHGAGRVVANLDRGACRSATTGLGISPSSERIEPSNGQPLQGGLWTWPVNRSGGSLKRPADAESHQPRTAGDYVPKPGYALSRRLLEKPGKAKAGRSPSRVLGLM